RSTPRSLERGPFPAEPGVWNAAAQALPEPVRVRARARVRAAEEPGPGGWYGLVAGPAREAPQQARPVRRARRARRNRPARRAGPARRARAGWLVQPAHLTPPSCCAVVCWELPLRAQRLRPAGPALP